MWAAFLAISAVKGLGYLLTGWVAISTTNGYREVDCFLMRVSTCGMFSETSCRTRGVTLTPNAARSRHVGTALGIKSINITVEWEGQFSKTFIFMFIFIFVVTFIFAFIAIFIIFILTCKF